LSFEPTVLWAIVALPLAGFVVNGLAAFLAPERKAIPTWVGPAAVGLAFGVAVINLLEMLGAELDHAVVQAYWSWLRVGDLRVDAALQLDQLSILMALVITGVGFVIHLFSIGYMREDPGYARYFAYLNLFVFFMLVLVLGASLPMMFVGWEGVGLCSYLLIGFWFRDREKADAGKKAFIVNRIGDAGFLIAMFLIFTNFGTLDFAAVNGAASAILTYGGGLATAITLFLFLGAVGKSAQIPLYVWLPDAMAGPTPVSALIHAATMVTAGVYLVVRTGVLFALAPSSMVVVAGVGALTALFAATIGLAQTDIKKVLAYSTVSQLGFMFIGVGIGAFSAGMFHLVTHAFFKALLFLGSGAVIHAMHHAFHHTHKDWDAQDMRNMGGLRRFMPVTWITMWIGTLAIAGIWPFAGFFSKDEIIWQVGARAVGPFAGWFALFWFMALAAAMMTAFYMSRLMILTFHGENRSGEAERKHLHEVPLIMSVPLVALAVLSLLGGWINVNHEIGALPLLGWVPHAEWLHAWLHPVTGQAEAILMDRLGELRPTAPVGGGEGLWAFLALAISAGIVVTGSRVLLRRTPVPAVEAAPARGFTRVLANKWYVDEIYDAIIVRPIVRASSALWRFVDVRIIDGAVNGVALLSRGLGWAGARLQTGQVNTYAFAIVIGMLILLAFAVL
jgi:NADH-quinone oxidoreductase subunit L